MTSANLMEMADSSPKGQKTLGGKGEIARYAQFILLSRSFQKKLVLQTSKNIGIFGRSLNDACNTSRGWINPFPNKLCFLRVCSTRLLKTMWEKLLVIIKFLLFPHCFLPICRTF